MELYTVLIIYLVFVIIVYLLFCKYGIKGGSSFVLGLIMGQIGLNILRPPHSVEEETSPSSYAIYMLIELGTPIVLYIYAFSQAINDLQEERITFHIDSPRKRPHFTILGKDI